MRGIQHVTVINTPHSLTTFAKRVCDRCPAQSLAVHLNYAVNFIRTFTLPSLNVPALPLKLVDVSAKIPLLRRYRSIQHGGDSFPRLASLSLAKYDIGFRLSKREPRASTMGIHAQTPHCTAPAGPCQSSRQSRKAHTSATHYVMGHSRPQCGVSAPEKGR